MSRTPLTLFVAAVALVLAVASFYLGRSTGSPPPQAQAAAPAAAASAERKVLYWQDPMVPGRKFDKPGKSPFMDMQLVPVYADSDGDEGTVRIGPSP